MNGQYTIEDLIEIVEKLRGENGCPWDKVQTHESIKKSFIEEVYEAIDALDAGNDEMFANELGDVLLQVVFHAQIAKERGAFDFNTCLNEICTKLISRHSHVFGSDRASDAEESLSIWEKNKLKEKGLKSYTEVLDDVPHSLPALMRAEKVLKKASDSGVIDISEDKTSEKTEEFRKAVSENRCAEELEEKFGDMLLEFINIGRMNHIDAETALYKASNRFISRFSSIEKNTVK